jgi:hypothetical protein
MRGRVVAGFLSVSMLLAATAAPVVAAEHWQPGTPGTPNCVGQTAAYFAAYSKLWLVYPGIGNGAPIEGHSVQEWHELARTYCGVP